MSNKPISQRWDIDKSTSQLVRDLIEACNADDLVRAETILAMNSTYFSQSYFLDTSRYGISLRNKTLDVCSWSGNIAVVELFVRQGADFDQPFFNGDGEGLILLLAKSGADKHLSLIEWLTARKAVVHHVRFDRPVSDTLIAAAMGGSLRAVKQLVHKCVPINGQSYNRLTALDFAINEGHRDVADYLRSVGAVRRADLDPPATVPVAPPPPPPKPKSKKRK